MCSFAEALRRIRGFAVPSMCWVLTLTDGPRMGTTIQEVGFCRLGRNGVVSQKGKGLHKALRKKGWIEAAWEDRGWSFILGKPFGSFSR